MVRPHARARFLVASLSALLGLAAPAVAQDACTGAEWVSTFGGLPGVDGTVFDLQSFDDGSGSSLFAVGGMTTAGGAPAQSIARWNGIGWTPVGGGLWGGFARALEVFDDGSGEALYVGGNFTHVGAPAFAGGAAIRGLARWDGSSWSTVGAGLVGRVSALCVFDDGSGPALYAGGEFTSVGGVAASNIARWNGQTWSPLGAGVSAEVLALAVWDDGTGPALYVGGYLLSAGGASASRIAKWNGTSWSPLGLGVSGPVLALAVHDDGDGAELVVGGTFSGAFSGPGPGLTAQRIARWNGTAWSIFGGTEDIPSTRVDALVVHDFGTGPQLFVGGNFASMGGVAAPNVARWSAGAWSSIGSGANASVLAMGVHDEGAGERLFIGGAFTSIAGKGVVRIARWDGQNVSALGNGLDGGVTALIEHDDGSGPSIFVGGHFTSGHGKALRRVARWDGNTFHPLGSGVADTGNFPTVNAFAVFDDGSGEALFAAGDFDVIGGVTANHIARWDGQAWSSVGGGMDDIVLDLLVHDDGSGPALFAAGEFSTAGGQSTNRVAKWDGQSWQPLGTGVFGPARALATFTDAGGSVLFVGGEFTFPGRRVARWDGQDWGLLGIGIGPDFFDSVSRVDDLQVFDAGSGSALYATGSFDTADDLPAANIARWNGMEWTALPGGGLSSQAWALAVHDDGSGPGLYAVGAWNTFGGGPSNGIARYDGGEWTALGSGLLGAGSGVYSFDSALLSVPTPSGRALLVGSFFGASPAGDANLALWGCPSGDFGLLVGCEANPAELSSPSGAVTVGASFELDVRAGAIDAGVAALFAGLDGTSGGGCGLFVPGLGELLLGLAPEPVLIGFAPLAAGEGSLPVGVPPQPGLVGLALAFQAAVVGLFEPGTPLELSNGLTATVAP